VTDAGKTATADASAGSASAEPAPPAAPRVIVLADDLIWQSRLVDHLRAAGAEPVRARGLDGLERALPSAGVAAIERATAAGARVLAVGQHDDHELRRRAREAGAERVLAYRKLFEDGPTTLATWLRSPIRVPG
jgi:hypothetical protein